MSEEKKNEIPEEKLQDPKDQKDAINNEPRELADKEIAEVAGGMIQDETLYKLTHPEKVRARARARYKMAAKEITAIQERNALLSSMSPEDRERYIRCGLDIGIAKTLERRKNGGRRNTVEEDLL